MSWDLSRIYRIKMHDNILVKHIPRGEPEAAKVKAVKGSRVLSFYCIVISCAGNPGYPKSQSSLVGFRTLLGGQKS